MARAKSKFGYTKPVDTAPELSKDFKIELAGIASTTPEKETLFMDEMRLIVHRYRLRNKGNTSLETGRPTKGQKKVNAEAIKKTAESLAQYLKGDAGGLKRHLNFSLEGKGVGYKGDLSTQGLVTALTYIQQGCDDAIDAISVSTENNSTPRKLLAIETGKAIQDILGEKPTVTIYQGKKEDRPIGGLWALTTNACFIEAEGRLESDIHGLMRMAAKEI